MKRKVLIALLSAATATCCAVGLAACTDGDTNTSDNKSDKYPYYVREENPPTNLDFAYGDDGNIIIGEQSKSLGEDGVTDIVIPSAVNDVPVTEIAASAFIGNTKITSVTIPNSITKIGDNAFTNCSSLKTVKIPDSVTELGTGVFSSCTSLVSVTIGAGLETIPDATFQACTSLMGVNIPSTVVTIGENAFDTCSSLSMINMLTDSETGTTNLKTIGAYAFSGCGNLQKVAIVEGVEYLGKSAFANCRGLKTLIIPDSVLEIGATLLENTENIEYLSIPFTGKHRYDPTSNEDVTDYANFAWLYGANNTRENSDKTKDMEFNQCNIVVTGVSDASPICRGAFNYVWGIKTIIVKGNPTVIQEGTFAFVNNDRYSVDIVIPSSITRIEDQVFWGVTVGTIFFEGGPADYKITSIGELNTGWDSATRRFYSEDYQANYWHYVNDLPVLW